MFTPYPNKNRARLAKSPSLFYPPPLTDRVAVPLSDPHRLQVVVQLARLIQQLQCMQCCCLLAGLAAGSRGGAIHLAGYATVAG